MYTYNERVCVPMRVASGGCFRWLHRLQKHTLLGRRGHCGCRAGVVFDSELNG